jgi:hypothetical protein
MKGHLVAMLFSDDISLEGLQQELEECKYDVFINASLFFNFLIVPSHRPCFIM